MTARRFARLAVVRWLVLGSMLPGCAEWFDPADVVIVATAWPRSDRERIAAEYAGPIRWVVLDPSDDPSSLGHRSRPPDIVLGGSLARHRRLPLLDGTTSREARRDRLGMAVADGPRMVGTEAPTFDDPRRDPIALAWARSILDADGWGDGYARLVRAAGSPRPIGRFPGAAVAAVERREAARTPAVPPRDGESRGWSFQSVENAVEVIEGVSALRGAAHPGSARSFLQRFPRLSDGDGPENDAGLLADLLGSTLVEAQDELRDAWDALERAGHPERAERWMTLPPPWPPASVGKLLARESNAMALLETLAGQLAPEADARAWLLRSWLSPAHAIDGAFLNELSRAVEGRVAREPRFRSWLRSEWTAWARQRYRRVARNATGEATRP